MTHKIAFILSLTIFGITIQGFGQSETFQLELNKRETKWLSRNGINMTRLDKMSSQEKQIINQALTLRELGNIMILSSAIPLASIGTNSILDLTDTEVISVSQVDGFGINTIFTGFIISGFVVKRRAKVLLRTISS